MPSPRLARNTRRSRPSWTACTANGKRSRHRWRSSRQSMSNPDNTRIVLGVTGNIATGKSTVVSMLRELGAHHIDSDLVYRDLVGPGQPLLKTLAEHFGE